MARLTKKEIEEALAEHKKDCDRCREKICKFETYHENSRQNCLQEKDIRAYEELLDYRMTQEKNIEAEGRL